MFSVIKLLNNKDETNELLLKSTLLDIIVKIPEKEKLELINVVKDFHKDVVKKLNEKGLKTNAHTFLVYDILLNALYDEIKEKGMANNKINFDLEGNYYG